MNLSIEPVSEAHFAGLRAALDTVAREKRFLAFTQAPPVEQALDFYRSIIANGGCQMVALLDGQVAGWCDVLPSHGQARSHVGILGIGLVPSARHLGIGAKLMQATIAAAWAKGMTRIELTVRADNTNAKALYERLGFEVEGLLRRAFRVDGEYFDSYSMALLRGAVEAPVPASELLVRAARLDDAVAAAACVNAAFELYVERMGKAPAPMLADHPALIGEDKVWVAVRSGQVAGVLVQYETEEGFYVDTVAVAPMCQGTGVGRALLRFAEREALRRGFEAVYLRTNAKMTENQVLYPKIGYVEYDRRTEGGYERIFYRKPLVPAASS
ncbi:GNAT family N-acetyltransferase [Variovorax paradoxus]|nr:GNAT family N-acetyltransferase [Variovorax paradoxus]MBT2305433.1 GNAT family N-acetyltransferase [Variovorax paradoxus]